MIAAGKSLNLDPSFDPTVAGSATATLTFFSNDDVTPWFTIELMGFGLDPDPVLDISIFDENNNFGGVAVRKSNKDGYFMLAMPPRTEYEISIFDPVSGLIVPKTTVFRGSPGVFRDLTPSFPFKPSTSTDTDFDGLPDDIEFAIGTAINKVDTDEDGLSDFVEIKQGLDPLMVKP